MWLQVCEGEKPRVYISGWDAGQSPECRMSLKNIPEPLFIEVTFTLTNFSKYWRTIFTALFPPSQGMFCFHSLLFWLNFAILIKLTGWGKKVLLLFFLWENKHSDWAVGAQHRRQQLCGNCSKELPEVFFGFCLLLGLLLGHIQEWSGLTPICTQESLLGDVHWYYMGS